MCMRCFYKFIVIFEELKFEYGCFLILGNYYFKLGIWVFLGFLK